MKDSVQVGFDDLRGLMEERTGERKRIRRRQGESRLIVEFLLKE